MSARPLPPSGRVFNPSDENSLKSTSLPPSHQSSRSSLHSSLKSQDEIRSALTDDAATPPAIGRTDSPRNRYQYPNDPLLRANLNLINEYLRKTELEELFNSLFKVLMSRPELPYNPYPGFVRRFKVQAERFHLFEKSHDEIMEFLNNKVQSTPLSFIVRPLKCDFVWSLPSVASVVEPDMIKQYLWLINDLIPSASSIISDPSYSVNVIPALVGPSLFHGSLYAYPHSTDVRIQFLVSGPEVNQAVAIFIESVIQDVTEMERGKQHTLLGVGVPVPGETQSDEWSNQLWTYEQLLDQKREFWQCASEAISGNKYIYAECILNLTADGSQVRRGQKQYSLFFTQTSNRSQPQLELTLFTEFPLVTLFEGAFTKQHHAESYLTTYTPRDELPDEHYSSDQSNLPVTPKLQEGKPVKVKIDGFRIGDYSGRGPQAWQVKAPVMSHWQRKIASLDVEAGLFHVVHYAILLTLMDRDGYDEKLLTELYRILHSTAARVHYAMQLNKTIRELILKYLGKSHSSLVMKLFLEYRWEVMALCDTTLQEWSSDQITVCEAILQSCEEMISEENSLPLTREVLIFFMEWAFLRMLVLQTVESMKNINSYLSALLLCLTEDTLSSCPNLQDLMKTLQDTFPDDAHRPKTALFDHRHRRQIGSRVDENEVVFKHGREEEAIMRHEDQVLNIEMCIERDNAPKAIAVDNVLLKVNNYVQQPSDNTTFTFKQYIVDTHLDKVWPKFLIDLLSGPTFPPNPFPRLVTTFRQCAMKMDLCYEKENKVRERLTHGAARLKNEEHHVHHIPGTEAHGLQSALRLLDSQSFSDLISLLQPFIQTNFMLKRGPYRVAVCTAVRGAATLFGRMDPYLREVILDEHCYIRGPDGCAVEASEIYTKITYNFIKELSEKSNHFISGFHIGTSRWSIDDLIERKKAFAQDFEKACSKKEAIFVKIFIQQDWRLVPVEKHFRFHYLNDDETSHETFFPYDPTEIYESVFFDEERAAFHVQYSDIKSLTSNPFGSSTVRNAVQFLEDHILSLAKRQNWTSVHRKLLLRDLILQESSMVVDSWRMFHSIASQFEYAIHLGRALQDLTLLCIDRRGKSHGSVKEGSNRQSSQADSVSQGADSDLEKIMGKMGTGYRQKIERIAKSQVAMASKGLLQTLQNKMKRIMERDEVSRELILIANKQTIYIIDEISHILQEMQDCLAYDVHHSSDTAKRIMTTVKREFTSRPSSVASIQLSDPGEYSHRPKANMSDVTENWLH
ncbi:hypothetical protein CAPTEDRAFT_227162 [Capitella teleta]|uniref:Uncharacterized protein n=1 Tax=Capitella teleta TaxID=283909 RepID=R7UG63_CAPTE|nr:hypothetical protein CAPTEDRAFT_227162 [Capitella teleta]|eukprot:ELU05200.1 hypothetical protein CAPTEDRAFT_227162 [Capitella teleta]